MLRKLFGAGQPGTARGPRRAVAALLAVAAVAAGAWIVVHGTATARPAGCPAGLARRAGQCVGVTDGSQAAGSGRTRTAVMTPARRRPTAPPGRARARRAASASWRRARAHPVDLGR
ncbi:MAG TPA: hypothetical protein VK586_20395 [Streptosporangiaceae bacterium]|nr:hypothetical protein [Streptosporangiaceae bacterium]